MKVEKMGHPNECIKCVVNSCHYYMSGDHCGANMIEVKPRNATTSQETDCGTFKPANDMH